MTTSTERGHYNSDLTAKPYSVTLWGSNPDETDNDDCWTGDEFFTLAEALTCYRAICMHPTDGKLPKACGCDWEFVMIDGPDTHEVTANPDQRTQNRRRVENAYEWRREQAMQAGMAFGADGYNDALEQLCDRFKHEHGLGTHSRAKAVR